MCLVHNVLPAGEPIELVNVAFAQPQKPQMKPGGRKGGAREADPAAAAAGPSAHDVPDRLSGREAVAELRAAFPTREFRFVEVDVDVEVSVGAGHHSGRGNWALCQRHASITPMPAR